MKPQIITIEKGLKSDIKEISELYDDLNDYLAAHNNYPGWIKGIYPIEETAITGIKENNLFVMRMNHRIVGTVILRHKPELGYLNVDWHNEIDDQNIFYIYTFALHPFYLKKGIGKTLMDFIIDYSRQMNMKAIRLDVYEKNIPAIHLYKKCGFEYIDKVDLGYSKYGLDYFELYQKIL